MELLKLLIDPLVAACRAVHQRLVRADLRVSFDAAVEPWEGPVTHAESRRGWFYRLDVTNCGRRTAVECTARLAGIEPRGVGGSLGRPAVLKWAHEAGYRPIAIEPGETRKLDLFFILEGDPSLHFYIQMPKTAVGFTPDFDPMPYRVAVRTEAAGQASRVWSIGIRPGADAKSFAVSME